MAKQKTQNPTLIDLDFTMHNLLFLLSSTNHALCAYMQDTTQYGESYQNAYKALTAIGNEIEALKPILTECCKHKKGGDK